MAAAANTAIAAVSPAPMAIVRPGPLTTWQDKPFGAPPINAAGSVVRVVKIATSQASSW